CCCQSVQCRGRTIKLCVDVCRCNPVGGGGSGGRKTLSISGWHRCQLRRMTARFTMESSSSIHPPSILHPPSSSHPPSSIHPSILSVIHSFSFAALIYISFSLALTRFKCQQFEKRGERGERVGLESNAHSQL